MVTALGYGDLPRPSVTIERESSGHLQAAWILTPSSASVSRIAVESRGNCLDEVASSTPGHLDADSWLRGRPEL